MIRPLVTRCGINMSVKNLLCQRLFGSTSTPSSKPVTRSMPVENMKESNFVIWENFISVEEEKACLDFVAPALARRRYQENHWDDVISKYKEIEMPIQPLIPHPQHGIPRSPAETAAELQKQQRNHLIVKRCIDRIHAAIRSVHDTSSDIGSTETATDSTDIPKPMEFLSPHVIDLAADGHIGAHVDSLKFSGKLICGLSLLSARVLRLVKTTDSSVAIDNTNDTTGHDNKTTEGGYGEGSDREAFLAAIGDTATPVLEVLVRPRSLYIVANEFRYKYTHEILGKHSPVSRLLLGVASPLATSIDVSVDHDMEELQNYQRRLSFMIRDTWDTKSA